jgi:hypothetical protein
MLDFIKGFNNIWAIDSLFFKHIFNMGSNPTGDTIFMECMGACSNPQILSIEEVVHANGASLIVLLFVLI